jgi:hypothetical protein
VTTTTTEIQSCYKDHIKGGERETGSWHSSSHHVLQLIKRHWTNSSPVSFQREMVAQHPSGIPSNSKRQPSIIPRAGSMRQQQQTSRIQPERIKNERDDNQDVAIFFVRSSSFVRRCPKFVAGGAFLIRTSHTFSFFLFFQKGVQPIMAPFQTDSLSSSSFTQTSHTRTHTPRYNHTTDHEELTSNTHTRSCPHTHRQMNRISAHTSRCAFNLEREWNNNGRFTEMENVFPSQQMYYRAE